MKKIEQNSLSLRQRISELEKQIAILQAEKYYSVEETIHTFYKTNDWDGRRYPSGYSIFTVISPTGKAIDSFSAFTHGVEDAKHMAHEFCDKLNKERRKELQERES